MDRMRQNLWFWLSLCLILFWTQVALAQESPLGKGKVSRSTFTSAVVDREPVDEVVVLNDGRTEIYFFTELKFLQGRTIIHRWEFNGQLQAEVAFKVGGPRWRVYSKKTLMPHQTGNWTVVVRDQETGWPLEARMFRFTLPGELLP